MKIEIKSRWDASVLFSVEAESWKIALELAVKSGADLEGADLRGADLRGADLEGADLRGADLRGADLRGADLEGADLEGADLEGANLEGADLGGANLEGANLESADLRGANLEGASIEKFPIQIGGHKHLLCTTHEGKLQIGCEVHTFDEWMEIAEKLGKSNGYSALDIEIYKLHIGHIEKVSRLLWSKK